jgi:hypothetical protein
VVFGLWLTTGIKFGSLASRLKASMTSLRGTLSAGATAYMGGWSGGRGGEGVAGGGGGGNVEVRSKRSHRPQAEETIEVAG